MQFFLKILNGKANSVDPDQTAPYEILGHLPYLFCYQQIQFWMFFALFFFIFKFLVCLFMLRFYGPVNPMGSCRTRSVYQTTRLLGRLSPLSR